MNGSVNSVQRTMVPPNSALAFGFGRVLLILAVLAVLAVNRPETLGGPQLHPSRLLLFVAHATGEKAAGVGRLIRPFLTLLLLMPLFDPHPLPADDGFGGQPVL